MDSSTAIASLIILHIINFAFLLSASAIFLLKETELTDLIEDNDKIKGERSAVTILKIKNNAGIYFSTLFTVEIGFACILSLGTFSLIRESVPQMLNGIDGLPGQAHVFVSIAVTGAIVVGIIVVAILISSGIVRASSTQFSLAISRIFLLLSLAAKPFAPALTFAGKAIMWPFSRRIQIGFGINEKLNMLLKEGRDYEEMGADNHELLNSVYEFSDIDVRDVMVPKPKIVSIQIDTPVEAALKLVVESGFSRFPVFRESLDDTAGILYNKDLLSLIEKKKSFTLREIIRPTHFVPEKSKVSDILKDMQKRHLNMFMVVNEFGSVVGLVTNEDIVEEIVGEVSDENEVVNDPVTVQDDSSMLVDASLTIRDLNNDYEMDLEESEEYDTLAGFMISKIDNIPKGGETVVSDGHKFTIMKMERRRITLVKLEKLVPTENSGPSEI